MARLEIRYDLRNPAFAGTDLADRYAAALDQIEWAEAHGFRVVTLSEHHGVPDGCLPSPLVFGAAVAARTRRIKIRVAALIAPLHDPLRIAEDAAVLDQLSRGRLELVLANGYVASEFAMFGRDLSARVPAVVEAVETLQAAWTGEPFEFRGRSVRVTPTPARQPRPPLLLGGASAGAARRAARIADLFFPTTAAHWEHYRAAVLEASGVDWGPMPPVAPRFVHVDDDVEAGWAAVEPFVRHERDGYGAWAADAGVSTGFEPTGAAVREDPNYVVVTSDGFRDLVEDLGDLGTIAVHPMMGGIPPELAWKNLHRMAAALGLQDATAPR
jgi:alkanesulfonate monooxygenase SsuD/methylene tetrahydromethanopterin reductase-like flavin-dependent oxidoreductase (luciferase family)